MTLRCGSPRTDSAIPLARSIPFSCLNDPGMSPFSQGDMPGFWLIRPQNRGTCRTVNRAGEKNAPLATQNGPRRKAGGRSSDYGVSAYASA